MKVRELNLYNKYRPKAFAEIIGQELAKKLLKQIFYSEKWIQSFIFYGPPGTGKTSVARILAKAWNCPKFRELGDVCNECNNCRLINESKTMDFYEIDAASHSGVESIREIIQNCQYMSLDLDKKVYLIDECHSLSSAAWNALLKIIEEPVSDSIFFIFVTTNIGRIPETILSRCQKYCFFRLTDEQLSELISDVCLKEKRIISKDAVKLLISLSQGSARECLNALDQVFLLSEEKNITKKDVEKVFFISDKSEILDFLALLIEGRVEDLLTKVDGLILANAHLMNYFSTFLSILMDLYVYQKTKNLNFIKLSEDEVSRFIDLDINFLNLSEIVYLSLRTLDVTYSKLEWMKILIFKLLDQLKVQKLPEKEVKVEEIKVEKNDILEIPQEIVEDAPIPPITEKVMIDQKTNDELIYGLSPRHVDIEKSVENFRIYSQLDFDKFPKEFSEIFLNQPLFTLGKSQKILLSTDRTIILVYPEESYAVAFNKFVQDPNIKNKLTNFFFYDYFWIAITKEIFREYKQRMKNISKDKLESLYEKNSHQREFEDIVKVLLSEN